MSTRPEADARLRCPRDSMLMEKVQIGDVTVDRCHSCGAMWFDAAELRRVLADSGAVDRLDVGGNPDAPQGYAVGTPRCPRDQTPLAEVPDNAQAHIHVDLCRTCRGVLLDAGELRDLSEFTLRERLRRFFGT